MKKILVTSALPYVNGDMHLGHLIGCWLTADVYARFHRALGNDVLFVCGADEHGTPTVIGAKKAGLPYLEYNNKFYEKQKNIMAAFNMSFDYYGRTHTPEHVKLVQEIFTRLDENGLIEERTMVQPFSPTDNMFLPDRLIKGACPKCGYENADGDQCEKCGDLLTPRDLVNPTSKISGAADIEWRETKHLFFLASAMEPRLREWLNTRAGWPKTATAIANKWLAEGVQDVSITRDNDWGVPVDKPGYENKTFYVWFDAPWGYVSISQIATPRWAEFWRPEKPDDVHYAEFMGKDNVAFHSIFFPMQQLGTNDNWKTVDMLKGVNFLNFEGAKFSKSKNHGIFMEQAIGDIADADVWRYALLSSAPETDDNDFTIRRFADIVNKDLNGMLGNFISRVTKITEKHGGAFVPPVSDAEHNNEKILRAILGLNDPINENLNSLTTALTNCEFRDAITALRNIWSIGNEFFTVCEPWNLVKTDPALAGEVLNECFQLIDFFSRVSAPFIPAAAERIQNIFAARHPLTWPSEYEHRKLPGTPFTVPENIFQPIDDDKVAAMTEKYSAK